MALCVNCDRETPSEDALGVCTNCTTSLKGVIYKLEILSLKSDIEFWKKHGGTEWGKELQATEITLQTEAELREYDAYRADFECLNIYRK